MPNGVVRRKLLNSDSNEIGIQNDLTYKRTLNHLAKWLSFRLRSKWFRVRISFLSVKLQIWHLLRRRSFLTFRQTIESGFTLKIRRWHDNNIQFFNSLFASWFLINLDFLLPHTSYFDNIITRITITRIWNSWIYVFSIFPAL